MAKWNLADEETAKECERLFQNGGPKVYVKEGWKIRPSFMSATMTVNNYVDEDEAVYARRKDGNRYVWKYAKRAG